jgi:hypothetical protein
MFDIVPKIINLGVVRGVCPANCVHCPVGETIQQNRRDKFGMGFMPIDDFKALCIQIKEFGAQNAPCLRIHGIGEPAAWTDLGEAFQFCKANEIKTWVFTMGLGTDRNTFLKTFSHADIVEFSINASDVEDFKQTKGLGEDDFSEITARMEALARLANKPRILVSRVQTTSQEKDADFIKFWKSKNLFDDVFIRSFHNYGDRLEPLADILNAVHMKTSSERSCLVPTARMNIDGVLGIVVRCFNELFDKPEIVQNKSIARILKDQTLKQIWFGDIMEDWRRNPFNYSECRNCTSCQPMNPNSSEHQLYRDEK